MTDIITRVIITICTIAMTAIPPVSYMHNAPSTPQAEAPVVYEITPIVENESANEYVAAVAPKPIIDEAAAEDPAIDSSIDTVIEATAIEEDLEDRTIDTIIEEPVIEEDPIIDTSTDIYIPENNTIVDEIAEEDEVEAVHSHQYGAPVTVPATCVASGYEAHTCITCGEYSVTKTLPIDENAHGEMYTNITKYPSCTEEGTQETRCSLCNQVIDTQTILTTSHEEGEWIYIGTEGTTKKYESYCINCGAFMNTYTKEIQIRYDGPTIPSADISIGLGYVELVDDASSDLAQYYTDLADYGAHNRFNGASYISDHNYQAFGNLYKVEAGTVGYLYGDQITCYNTCYGVNKGTDLYTNTGVRASSYGGYIIYTCTISGVFITFWS